MAELKRGHEVQPRLKKRVGQPTGESRSEGRQGHANQREHDQRQFVEPRRQHEPGQDADPPPDDAPRPLFENS